MSKLTKEQIYQQIKKNYANESEVNLREVSYNLSLANVVEANVLDLAAKSFEKLKRFSSKSLLAESAAKVQSNDLKSKQCPVCKMPMVLVNLLEGKKAHYCNAHRIVEPLPVEVEVDDI